ncbi:MAG TPA: prolyl oligopeptidase family serine peptidase [Candidatus Acidoferrales bacterium]|nr:prolyl oligopeptidase family serine peptidase [Candidatus Acidoferrales bacterium]
MRRLPALSLALLVAACSLGGARASPSPPHPASTPQVLQGTLGAATYTIVMPAPWNRTLVVYSHGYVAPGRPNPAPDLGANPIGAWLLGHGYALAASSYSGTGWALAEAVPDQIALLDLFQQRFGKPTRTLAWGHSLGGIITAALVQDHPERFAGALPMCGVLGGGVGTWNQALDAAFVLKTLLGPDSQLQLVHLTNPEANLSAARSLADAAQATPAGQARLALIAALGDLPGWFDPSQPQPAPADLAGRLRDQLRWFSVDFPYSFSYRADLEKRAGGNPSWNTGVDYRALLAASVDRDEVEALYQQAGLSLESDLARLAAAPRIAADPPAVQYLRRHVVFDGSLQVPVLSLHTTDDGLVVVQQEQAYAAAVHGAGRDSQLRQLYVHRAGHCTFTAAESLVAFQALVDRLNSGAWDPAALDPAVLDRRAAALGPDLNRLPLAVSFAAAPGFLAYQPAPFLRPFDARSPNP